MAGTNYSDDKIAYNAGINNDITTQTAPNTIGPDIVGPGFTDLADMLEPYILRINNNALLFGVPAPSNALGADYDIYYQQTNPINIYRKISGAWVLQGSLPINFTLPEGNLTVRTSISGFTVTATKGGWVIANTVYQKATQTQITVTAADLNFGRIDIVYADTSNNILYLTGIASSAPAAPSLPANTILIDQVIVPSQSSGNAPYLLFGGEDPSASGLNFADSTGLINGGILTINANPALFNVSAGTAFFVDFTDPLVPVKKTVSFGPSSGLTVTSLTTAPSSYIGVNGNGQIVQQITPFTNTQRRSIATLGILIHTNLTNINAVNAQGSIILAPADQVHDFMNAVGPLNLTGNKYSAASTNLTIQKTAGSVFKFGCNSNDFTNPHVASQPAGNPVTFRYRTRNGEVGGDITNVIPGSYDNAGTITAVGPSQFTIQHITMFQTGLTRIQYGQNLYSTLADAQAAAFSESFAVESNIAENGIFRAYLILRGNSTDLSNTSTCLFLEVPKFGGAAGNAGSALTAANIIAALGYTPVDGPASSTDNAIARYDGTTGNIIQDSAVVIDDNGDTLHNGTGAIKLNVGTTAQRPISLVDGLFRKNNTLTGRSLEYYDLTSATWRIVSDSTNTILNQTSVIQTAASRISGPYNADPANNAAGFRLNNASSTALLELTSRASFSSFDIKQGALVINATDTNSIASFGTGTFVLPRLSNTTNPTLINADSTSLVFNSNNAAGTTVVTTIKILGGNTKILSIDADKTFFSTTQSISLPFGTTGQRPTVLADGDFRKNNTLTGRALEYYDLTSATWRFILDSNNGIQNQSSTPQVANWWISGMAKVGGTLPNVNAFEVVGTNADPATSGTAANGAIRVFGTGFITTMLDIGVSTTSGSSWIQSRDAGSYSVNRQLKLNPNGGDIIFGGSVRYPIRTITISATLTLNDFTILINPAANVTVSLPPSATCSGIIYNVKRIVTASNTITIDPDGSETIDGAATFNLATLNQSIMIQSNGTAWFIISQQ